MTTLARPTAYVTPARVRDGWLLVVERGLGSRGGSAGAEAVCRVLQSVALLTILRARAAKAACRLLPHCRALSEPRASPKADVDDDVGRVILKSMSNPHDYLPSVPEPEVVGFSFELHDAGWASLETMVGGRSFTIPSFGYMTDGLGDLVRAALQVATGGSHVGVIFDEEPQRWGLALEPTGLSDTNKRIARLTIRDGGTALSADGWSNPAVWRWATQPVLEGYVETDNFARAVQIITASARARYSDAVYRGRWGYHGSLEGFPLRGLKALEAALAVQEYRE